MCFKLFKIKIHNVVLVFEYHEILMDGLRNNLIIILPSKHQVNKVHGLSPGRIKQKKCKELDQRK